MPGSGVWLLGLRGVHLIQDGHRGRLWIAGLPDRPAHDNVVSPRRNGLCRCHYPLLIAGIAAHRTDAGGDNQLAFSLGQGPDKSGLVGGADDPVGAIGQRKGCAFLNQICQASRFVEGQVQIRPIKRCEDGDGKDLHI